MAIGSRNGCQCRVVPGSNEFLFGRTVCISDVTRRGIPVALGTDSPLTAEGDLLDEIHVAAQFCPLAEIRRMLTTQAARVLRTQNRDYIAGKEFGAQPELVVVGGKVQLVSERLASTRGCRTMTSGLGTSLTVFVRLDVPSLVRAAQSALESDEVRVGGRKVVLLRNGSVETLPIVMLDIQSRCNCRCIMCDIWKQTESRT